MPGRWASIHLASLEENRPDLLEQLRRNGELDSYLSQIEAAARQEHSNVLAELRRRHPMTLDSLRNAQTLMMLDGQASELVIEGLVVPPKDESGERPASPT